MGCCGRKGGFPSLSNQVKNLTVDIANVIAYAKLTGEVKADKDLVEKRVYLCKACPRLKNGRCTACGCFISLKAGLQASSCPLKKW